MAYLHCHSCDFSQDDFWSPDGWNIMESLKDYKDDFFRDDFFEDCGMDSNWKEEIGYGRDAVVTRQEILAHTFENCAKKIRNMKFRTFEEFKEKNPEGICPLCGEKNLDID